MSRRPDGRSVDFLRRVGRSFGLKGRLRAAFAVWTYRLSIWPKSLLLFTTLAVLVLVLYTTALWDLTKHNPWGLMHTAEQADDDALGAIERLDAMAHSKQPQLSVAATTSLHLALAAVAAPHRERGASELAAINELLDAFPPRSAAPRVEVTLASILRDPSRDSETRTRVLKTLQRIGSRQSVETLRRFAESAPENPPSLRAGSGDSALTLKRQALHALRDMTDSGVAPLVALLGLQDSLPFSEELKAEAAKAADGVDPLIWAEYLLERSDYGAAYDRLSAAQQSPRQDAAYQQRVTNALAKVHLRRGLVRLRDAELNPQSSAHLSAASDLSAALNSGADADSLQEASSYGLRLGFLLHEMIALRDPDAFEESYKVYASVASISRKASNDLGIRVDADLAEAALTVGRYDEAYQRAKQVITELEGKESELLKNTSLNARFVAFAALLLKKDDVAARRASEELYAEYRRQAAWVRERVGLLRNAALLELSGDPAPNAPNPPGHNRAHHDSDEAICADAVAFTTYLPPSSTTVRTPTGIWP